MFFVLFFWVNCNCVQVKCEKAASSKSRLTIHPLFLGHVLAGISKLPKISRFWLCFLTDMLSTVLAYIICIHICISLTVFVDPSSHAVIGWLCIMPARYWLLLSASIKPKPGYFRQFRNSSQGTSGKKRFTLSKTVIIGRLFSIDFYFWKLIGPKSHSTYYSCI